MLVRSILEKAAEESGNCDCVVGDVYECAFASVRTRYLWPILEEAAEKLQHVGYIVCMPYCAWA